MNLTILSKKISLKFILISVILTNIITYYFITNEERLKSDKTIATLHSELNNSSPSSCSYKVKRLSGFNYVNPILFVDNECESDKLNTIKQSISSLIDNYKKDGIINSASIYIKEFNENGWTGINTDEKYFPGSLMKIPMLFTFLKEEEENPGYLNKEIAFTEAFNSVKKTQYKSKSITLGQKYSIRELLNYMIVYSDNDATSLLYAQMNLNKYKKVFTDLNLQAPDLDSLNHTMTAREVSYFMRVLFNATYLNDINSEFATVLLQKCNFKEGIVSRLPNTVKVAHKYGESGNQIEQQLNETAIVYLENNPYVITVMTKGRDYKLLPQVMREISRIVYQNMVNN